MRCTSCDTTLSPDMVTCPVCGTPALSGDSQYSSAEHDAPYTEQGNDRPSLSRLPPAEIIVPEVTPFMTDMAASSPALATLPQPSVPAAQHKNSNGMLLTLLVVIIVLFVSAGAGIAYTAYYVVIYSPAQIHAQSTAIAKASEPQALYRLITSRKPDIEYSLDNTGSSFLPTEPMSDGSGCLFRDDSYHIVEIHKNLTVCPFGPSIRDFAIQVQMTIIKGDEGGLLFRADDNLNQYYYLGITDSGMYGIYRYTPISGYRPLREGNLHTFKAGLDQKNMLTLIARGSDFYIYTNQQFIAQLHDTTYSQGALAFLAAEYQEPTDVAFQNLQLWYLS